MKKTSPLKILYTNITKNNESIIISTDKLTNNTNNIHGG